MKYLWVIFIPSLAFADCNAGGMACAIDSNCPINGTVYTGTWYNACGVAYCGADCHMHQPTYGCPDVIVWNGVCGGVTGCQQTKTASLIGCNSCGFDADCVNTVAFCTTGACPVWSPWANQGCAINGCGAGQMSQSSNGSGAACCGPTIQRRCVIDPSCTAPTITSFTAAPLTINLGDPVTFTWTLAGGPPTSQSINQGIGPVAGTSYVATPGVTGIVVYTLTVSNALGTTNANVTVTINPLPPKCGIGHICGNVWAAERLTQALPGIAVELYGVTGSFLQSVFTDGTGRYDLVAPTGQYIIHGVPDRLWNAAPSQLKTATNNVIGAADFTMRFVPAVVTVRAAPATFFSFTQAPIIGPTPPPVQAGGLVSYSAVAGTNNQMTIEIPGGYDYYMTCWNPGNWQRGPSKHINGGAILWPRDQITEVCL